MISVEALELLLKVDSAVEHHDIGLMGEARYLDAKENLQDYIASLESQLADAIAKRDALMDCFFEFETIAPNGELMASVLDMHKRLESLELQLAEAKADLSNTREAWNECENTLAEAKARLAWIPVSEPPTNYRDETGELIPFLVCENDGDYPFRAIYDGTNWGDGIFKADITHWMPLPSAPKEEE